MYKLEIVLQDNRLMSVLEYEPILFIGIDPLFAPVRFGRCLEIDRVSDIFYAVKNVADSPVIPPCRRFPADISVAVTFSDSINCRSEYLIIGEYLCDLKRTVSLDCKPEYPLYHCRGFFVDHPHILVVFGFPIAVWRVT